RPPPTKDLKHRPAQRLLIELRRGHKEGGPAVSRSTVGSIEPDQMIDAKPIVEIRVAPRSLAEPPETVGGHDVPTAERHPPVLSGGAERIGRHTNRDVESKLILTHPDICAVTADHEGEIAKNPDAVSPTAHARPLRVREPLQVSLEQHLFRELAPRSEEN